jgi:hypothetical protein
LNRTRYSFFSPDTPAAFFNAAFCSSAILPLLLRLLLEMGGRVVVEQEQALCKRYTAAAKIV